jgi:CTP:molybdopterin cytidylyltransferase MocA
VTLYEPHHAGKAVWEATQHPLHALVLAAGRGRRFGGAKLHATYQDRPLLAYPLSVVAAACNKGLLRSGHVVIADNDEKSRLLVHEMNLQPVLNNCLDQGMSHSIRVGLEAVELYDEQAAGALIFLGDQPLVHLSVVEALISAWQLRPTTIIRPLYEAAPNVPGHPVLVPRGVWPEIRELTGDVGFGRLPGHWEETFLIRASGDNPDVDTLRDLQVLEALPR